MPKQKPSIVYVVMNGTIDPSFEAVFSSAEKAYAYIENKRRPLDMQKRMAMKVDLTLLDKMV